MRHQQFSLDTLTGERTVKAPAGYKFDRTTKIVWFNLVHTMYRLAELEGNLRRPTSAHILTGKKEAYTAILAYVFGMAPFYWEQEASNVMKEGFYVD